MWVCREGGGELLGGWEGGSALGRGGEVNPGDRVVLLTLGDSGEPL